MPYAELSRHRIRYECAGTRGSPVMLIMGFGMPGSAWRHQVPSLSRAHRVCWFDHAGVGDSGPIASARLRMSDLADDVLELLDTLGWERAHVVGISMGGMIAQHLALQAPSRVRSLTLAATHAGGLRHAVPPLRGIQLFAQANLARGRDRFDALARLLYSDSFLETHGARALEMLQRDFARPPSRRVRLAHMHAIARHRTADQLHELASLETLIVRPGQDVLIDPRQSDRLLRLIPGARMVRFDDSGHGVTRQCAGRFNELALEHFAAVDGATELG